MSNGLIIASILESLILYSSFPGIIESNNRKGLQMSSYVKIHLILGSFIQCLDELLVQIILNTFHAGQYIQYICLPNAY